MASVPNYVFRLKVAGLDGVSSVPVKDEQLVTRFDQSLFVWVWKRIWDPFPGGGLGN